MARYIQENKPGTGMGWARLRPFWRAARRGDRV